MKLFRFRSISALLIKKVSKHLLLFQYKNIKTHFYAHLFSWTFSKQML